jgi:hypothetical protein
VLTLALPVEVAALVGGVPGMRHVVWQVAACELHVIMQLVTVEVCARRIVAAALAAPPDLSQRAQADKTPIRTTNRMTASPDRDRDRNRAATS